MSEVWTPRPDQQRVLDWLLPRRRGLLLAPTGSGKTAIASTWLSQKMGDEFSVTRALVVAPKLVVAGWREQIARWQHLHWLLPEIREITFEDLDLTMWDEVVASAPGRVHKPYSVPRDVVFGPGLETRRMLDFRDKKATKRRLLGLGGRLHLCSWDAFPWVEESLGKAWPYDALVPDESSFLRDRSSARGKAARRAVHKSGKVTHALLLTATPNANHDEAAFSQVDLVAPGLLGNTLTEFRDTYCQPDSKNWSSGQVYSWKIAPGMREQFEQRVASVSLSVPESLGIDVLEVEHWVELPDDARELYKELSKTSVLQAPVVTCGSEAVLHGKQRQIATGFVYDDTGAGVWLHKAKLDALRAVIDSLGGKQALVVYEFDEELATLRGFLGKDFADIRDKGARARFMKGTLPYLGLHPKSAGHGVDGLQERTNVIIWHTVTEDREMYDQTNGRLKRPGQDAPTVMAHALIARGTVEQRIWEEVLPGKARRADRLILAARGWDSQTVVESPDVR